MSESKVKVKRKQYDAQQLVAAVQAVKDGMKISEAARKYEVPWTTLGDHVRNKTREGAKLGNQLMLSETEEEALANYLKYMATRNMPLRRRDIRKIVVDIIRKSGITRVLSCTFNLNKGPSDNWFLGFEKRHPDVKWAIDSETCNKNDDPQTKDYVISQFLNLYESVLEELDIKDKPQQIFNYDETWGNEQVSGVGENYSRKVIYREPITVMMAASASGRVLPTMLIFKDCLPDSSDAMPQSWQYAISEDGYIDKELFLQWFRDVFIPNCGSQRPVLLVLDNHESHISSAVIDLAKENQIEMLAFPSQTTHILQPMELGIFGLLKETYKQLCTTAGLKNKDVIARKDLFATMWDTCVEQAPTSDAVKTAFRRTGLYPFNPYANIVDQVIVNPEEASDPKKTASTQVKEINAALGATVPGCDPCKTCGRYPHSVSSVRALSPELELAIPLATTQELTEEVLAQPTKKLKTEGSDTDEII